MVALLSLSSWWFVIVVGLFLAVPWVCLKFVIVVLSTHTHYFENEQVILTSIMELFRAKIVA